jgi:hypothetical protein
LNPHVAVDLPARISELPAPAVRVKCRVPAASVVAVASGGMGSGRDEVLAGFDWPAAHPADRAIGVAASPIRKARLETTFMPSSLRGGGPRAARPEAGVPAIRLLPAGLVRAVVLC